MLKCGEALQGGRGKDEAMTKNEIREQVKLMMAAPSCCAEAKNACDAYLKAEGTPDEKKAAKALLDELKEDVTSIDGLIGLCSSTFGKEMFGEERAAAMLAAAEDAKAKGGKYCICGACQAGGAILDAEADLLA